LSSYVEGVAFGGVVESLRWGDFLTIVNAKSLPMEYSTGTDSYTIWAVDGPITYRCQLIFSGSSSKYPFPFADGYTATQNNTDVGTFTGTYQAGANAKTQTLGVNLSTGATTSPLSSSSVSVSSSGNNTLVAGVSGKTVRVFKLVLVFSAAANATFQDGSSTALSGAIPMLANGSIVLDFDTVPWYVTSSGNAFVLNLSTGVTVTGTVYYTQS
jgi:hypothetical protein